MTEDESEPDPTGAEEFAEMIQQQREQRIEQVTFEWVQTVREAGEAYRDTDDIEAVAAETGEDEETTEEALTVYRLIFEKQPMWTGSRAIETGRAYFSLDRKLEDGYDSEEWDEPAEKLLREYVGGLYLEEDIEDEPVGGPPERDEPPQIDMGELINIPNSEWLKTATLSGVDLDGFLQSHTSAIANSMDVMDVVSGQKRLLSKQFSAFALAQSNLSFIEDTVSTVAAVLQSQREISQELAVLTGGFTDAYIDAVLPSISMAVEQADTLSEIGLPPSVLADLQKVDDSTLAAAAAYSQQESDLAPEHTDSATTTDRESPESNLTDVESVEDSVSSPATDQVAASTIDATLPDPQHPTTEVAVEVPGLIVQTMLSSGEAYRWFKKLDADIQNAVVGMLLIAITLQYNPSAAVAATFLTPVIRKQILNRGSEDKE